MPHLHRIIVYPIKSLDGVIVEEATLLPSGALTHDREYALLDSQGQFVNGKRTDRVHRIRLDADLAEQIVQLRIEGETEKHLFHLEGDKSRLEEFLCDFFEMKVTLARSDAGGFPDDTEASGPTVISTETLKAVCDWFPGTSLEEMRRRFRPNLEIQGKQSFWEDRLYASAGQVVRFQVGAVLFEGQNPSQRCVVPTRDAATGKADPKFAHTFAVKRQETLPPWAPASRFDHYYRLAVNTRVPVSEADKCLRPRDEVTVLETVKGRSGR